MRVLPDQDFNRTLAQTLESMSAKAEGKMDPNRLIFEVVIYARTEDVIDGRVVFACEDD